MKEWQYDPYLSLEKPFQETLSVFPREKDMCLSALRYLWGVLTRGWLKLYFRFRVEGRENLPKEESFVFISNHSSHLDAICLSVALPLRSISANFSVAAKDYFFGALFKSFMAAVFLNAIPFERKKSPRKSLELCADVLKVSGRTLILFPEGTRSMDGRLQPFKSGLGFLTASTQRLVVPACIIGAHGAWAKGEFVPKPKKVTLKIGKPLSFQEIPRTKEGFSHIANAAYNAVRQLQGDLL